MLELIDAPQLTNLGNAQRTTLQRHFGNSLLPIAYGNGKRHRNGLEIIAFTKIGEPTMILIFRTERSDVQTGIVLADFPLPRTVMLDLPHYGKIAGAAYRTFHLQNAGRLMLSRAPCRSRAHGKTRTRLTRIDFLVAVTHLSVTQRTNTPIVFHSPSGIAPENIRTMHLAAVDAHRNGQIQRRHRFNRQLLGGLQTRVGAHCGKIRERLEYGSDHQACIGIGGNRLGRGIRGGIGCVTFACRRLEFTTFRFKIGIRRELRDLQTERIGGTWFRFGSKRGNESQLAAGNCGNQRQSVVLRTGIGGTHLNNRTRILFNHWLSIVRQATIDRNHVAPYNVAEANGGIGGNVKQHGDHTIAPFKAPILPRNKGSHIAVLHCHLLRIPNAAYPLTCIV